METSQRAFTRQMAASIEMLAKHVDDEVTRSIPRGTRVYLPDLGPVQADAMPGAARFIRAAGAVPVPHIAARRIGSADELKARLAAFSADVDDVLIIAGEATGPSMPFPDTSAVLASRLLPEYGITHVGVAGHPEGHPNMTRADALEVLRRKQDLATDQGLEMRIVTQFGFNADVALTWAASLPGEGVTAPVHYGLAGPTDVATLVRYAARCGVANAASVLRKRGAAVLGLARGGMAEGLATQIEQAATGGGHTIKALHIYPFGGVERSRDWLVTRGNWAA